jgi:hypothetical protein
MGGKVRKRLGVITIEYPALPKRMTINPKPRSAHGNPRQQQLSENGASGQPNPLMMNVLLSSFQGNNY